MYKDDDTFLVNRGNTSYTIRAIDVKNLVNPTGKVDQPTVLKPTLDQGLPIQLDNIDVVTNSATPGEVILTLASNDSITAVGASEALEMSGEYTPRTTGIKRISGTGPYTIGFSGIDYDLKYFQTGDAVYTEQSRVTGTVGSVDLNAKEMVINTTDNWGSTINQKVYSTGTLTGTGDYKSHVANGSRVDVTVENSVGTWISAYNNGNVKFKVNTSKPTGGSQIDTAGFTFEASPFGSTDPSDGNPFLYLTGVIWILNGNEYRGEVTSGNQSWDSGSGRIIEGRNTIQVKYEAGVNFSYSPVVSFFASNNPITRKAGTIDYSTLQSYTSQVTTLGL